MEKQPFLEQMCEALAFSNQGQYTLFFMSCACDGHLNLCLSTSDSKQVLQHTKGKPELGSTVCSPNNTTSCSLWITPRAWHTPTLRLESIWHVIPTESKPRLDFKVAAPLLVSDILLTLASHLCCNCSGTTGEAELCAPLRVIHNGQLVLQAHMQRPQFSSRWFRSTVQSRSMRDMRNGLGTDLQSRLHKGPLQHTSCPKQASRSAPQMLMRRLWRRRRGSELQTYGRERKGPGFSVLPPQGRAH